jgi:hypothetical protein
MRNFLLDFDYYIDIYEKYIHVFNYVDIKSLDDKKIILAMNTFTLEIIGNNFSVKRLEKREILIEGNLDEVKIIK